MLTTRLLLRFFISQSPSIFFPLTSDHGKIVQVDVVADPDRLAQLELAVLD
jgi:hypothetical protein